MFFTTIIRAHELKNNYDPSSWVILDCRTDLQNPEWGCQSFLEKHIPGSIYADLNRDLSGYVSPLTGRHPLPDPALFIEKVSQWGIHPEIQVVAVDTANGTFAARIWWMLRALGHAQVSVLDGGFSRWLAESYPVESGASQSVGTAYRYPAEFSSQPFMTQPQVYGILNTPSHKILDARTPERYRGEVEPIDPVAGRIPGALNRPTSANLKSDGLLKEPAVLRAEFLSLLQETPPQKVTVYCGSGVTSCHNILAMEVAGFKGAALYPGSWSEWIRDPGNPIERG